MLLSNVNWRLSTKSFFEVIKEENLNLWILYVIDNCENENDEVWGNQGVELNVENVGLLLDGHVIQRVDLLGGLRQQDEADDADEVGVNVSERDGRVDGGNRFRGNFPLEEVDPQVHEDEEGEAGNVDDPEMAEVKVVALAHVGVRADVEVDRLLLVGQERGQAEAEAEDRGADVDEDGPEVFSDGRRVSEVDDEDVLGQVHAVEQKEDLDPDGHLDDRLDVAEYDRKWPN